MPRCFETKLLRSFLAHIRKNTYLSIYVVILEFSLVFATIRPHPLEKRRQKTERVNVTRRTTLLYEGRDKKRSSSLH